MSYDSEVPLPIRNGRYSGEWPEDMLAQLPQCWHQNHFFQNILRCILP